MNKEEKENTLTHAQWTERREWVFLQINMTIIFQATQHQISDP